MRRIATKEIILVKSAILSKRQGGACAICKKAILLKEACLDHDHSTGLIRGVLCRNCNGIEGKIKNLVTRGRRTLSHEDYLGEVLRYWMWHQVDRTNLYHPLHLTTDEKRIKRNAKARKVAAKKRTLKAK